VENVFIRGDKVQFGDLYVSDTRLAGDS